MKQSYKGLVHFVRAIHKIMRKLLLFILILFSVNSYCQKNIEITDNKISKNFYEDLNSLLAKYDLKDLRKSEDLAIRIWRQNEIISLDENSEYIFHKSNGQEEIIEKRSLDKINNLDSLYHLIESKGDLNTELHIDAYPIKIELSNVNSYKLISFQKNEALEEIVQTFREYHSLDVLKEEIINNLPEGNYGMRSNRFRKDYLPKEDKSDIYLKLEPEIRRKLCITEQTNPTEMPLIIIDNTPSSFEDLNNLEVSEVKEYEIINDKRKSIYGARGSFGIIKINTY